jgi:uncharacterized protein (DUF2062 family)
MRRWLKHSTAVMLDRRCWTFSRSGVTRSFALGLFIAFIPPTPLVPVHLVTCAPFLHAISHRTFWADISVQWAPLLLGALVLGWIAAASGYVLAQCLWRGRVMYQLRRRRTRSSRSASLN